MRLPEHNSEEGRWSERNAHHEGCNSRSSDALDLQVVNADVVSLYGCTDIHDSKREGTAQLLRSRATNTDHTEPWKLPRLPFVA